ncbi:MULTISPECIES: AHH domain-containing protein [unclassified Corallococcus]|uniref:AHH domain-containing protein n=1 Tax=unclassified Corallococcus TaxID=2685029 RepID=UPI001A8F0B10|nr:MULTISPECIES: AHH domain-containing protein [unclassified Corallococcus]MBN9681091.1 AHH domain-containing protein [Corallococcus sp. NCSPR001]WAS87315.1 AHH domain-containing protein [Corallococcus sp. NCRR]
MSSCRSWAVAVLLLLLSTGCSATRGVRLKTGPGAPVVHVPRAEVEPVELDGDAFTDAVRTLAEDAPVSPRPREDVYRRFAGTFSSKAYAHVRGRLGLVSVEEPSRARLLVDDPDRELASAYGRWCQRKQTPGDCLQLLEAGSSLDEEGRRSLAFAIALDSVWEETAEALVGMTDQRAVLATLVATGTVYLSLWLLPEPVSKGIAATMTVVLIAYLGIDTVWNLIQGWIELSEQARVARTFDELREVGEEYGEVMGKNAARAFVMLALAAVGSTAETFAAKVATLPGSGHASLVAAEVGGFRLGAAAQVESVAVSSEGVVTLVLPPNAVAMSARDEKSPVASGADAEGHEHHIASNKWWSATNRGGPWSPQFQKIFDKAGMSLDDPANKVRVPGHRGPHPEAYHQWVLKSLSRATRQCRSMEQCRALLTNELRSLARQITEKGGIMNRWVTGLE